MVCSFGMSDNLGMIEYGENESNSFMGRGSNNYSQDTAKKIDEEVKRLIDNAYAKAKEIIILHKDKLDAIAAGLLEYETLEGFQITEIMQHGYMINPPKDKPKPPTPPPVPKATEPRPVPQDDENQGGLPGGLAGVPA